MNIGQNIKELKNILPEEVNLVAVSKTKPIEDIYKAYEFGLRDFGENKVQELTKKVEEFSEKDVKWHLIGHLQRNKVKYIVGKVALIHSLDSIRLLKEVESRYSQAEKIADVLVQVNIAKEESKYGIYKEELNDMIDEVEKCNNVKVKGLMAIIPKGDKEVCKKYFKQMKQIFDKLKDRSFKNIQMKYLSMGMTGDYAEAIEEGSNMVRIGQGIFGERNYKK